jgi:beta-lactamase superfamily II metal-dependent hydrolase
MPVVITACVADRPAELCLTLLDVGQGDAILLELPRGEVWLVDGGGSPGGDGSVGRRVLLPELRRRGIERLDRLIISHADSDHYEGLFALVGVVDLPEVWLPSRRAGPRFRRLLTQLERAGSRLVVLDESPGAFVGPVGVEARLLHPRADWVAKGGTSLGKNNNSLVFSLSMGQIDFLLTGDMEQEAEQWLVGSGLLAEHEVLKLGHHGSRSSSSATFFDVVRPLVALAGTGRDNRWGFPHASVRRRVLRGGSRLFWTARHGSLRTCTDGWSLRVEKLVDGRVVTELGAWSPQQILVRNRELDLKGRSAVPTSRPVPRQTIKRSARSSARRSTSPRRRSQTRSRSRQPKAAKAAKERSTPDGSVSPTLIDERTWRRRRKARNRFRPGW